jgi:putative ABC transport system permease protein
MVVWQGMRLTGIGVVIGVVTALELTRFMAGLVYRVKTWDPTLFAAVVVLLSAVAWFASYLPARRASQVDPIVLLRMNDGGHTTRGRWTTRRSRLLPYRL